VEQLAAKTAKCSIIFVCLVSYVYTNEYAVKKAVRTYSWGWREMRELIWHHDVLGGVMHQTGLVQ